MSTLHELVYYCRMKKPTGALMLTGEWGCGKTYLVNNDLKEELKDSHIIVRVSLFGIGSLQALHTAVKKKWLYSCTHFISKVKEKEKSQDLHIDPKDIIDAAANVVRLLNPAARNITKSVIAIDPLDYIPIEPEVNDPVSGERKTVVLVFDDLDRSRLDPVELLGCINGYFENQHFRTIVIANEENLIDFDRDELFSYRMMKEKIISHTVLNCPDYPSIIHRIITEGDWENEKYGKYLEDHEKGILETFVSESPEMENADGKYHNLRDLTLAMQNFYRIFYHMGEADTDDVDQYFYSFLSYMLASRSGILKDGERTFTFTDDDIDSIYPLFAPDKLPDSIRKWIDYGVWDEDKFLQEI